MRKKYNQKVTEELGVISENIEIEKVEDMQGDIFK